MQWWRLVALSVFLVVGCGDDDGPGTGSDAGGGSTCSSDADCDDGTFCNGAETCLPGDPSANARGCAPAAETPCVAMGVACDEDMDACGMSCVDADGDGANDAACGGTDCADDDPERFPGNMEVCDAANLDEDCDESTFGFRDADMDAVADAACCNGAACGMDCNDAAPTIHPTAPETCDGLDNDCDGSTDEGVLNTFYVDGDGDGFGSAMAGVPTMEACFAPAGYAATNDDCDDAANDVNPAAAESCDIVDEDCDGRTDESVPGGCACTAGMMRSCGISTPPCSPGSQSCNMGMWGPCTGGTGPGTEVCNGINDDCDGATDEGVRPTCWTDPDSDGYAAMGAAMVMASGCVCPSGSTDRNPALPGNADCREMDASFRPGVAEICDRMDNDCSTGGGVEPAEDRDNDGYASPRAPCVGGPLPATDCADMDPNAHPGQLRFFSAPLMPPAEPGTLAYDYNCDGMAELVSPDRDTPSSCSGVCGQTGFDLIPGMAGYPPCGTTMSLALQGRVDSWSCPMIGCTPRTAPGVSRNVPMPCR